MARALILDSEALNAPLSHLSLDDASKILGPDARRLLIRGGALELAAPDALRIDEHEVRVQWEPGPRGLTSRLFFDPSVRGGLRAVCSACTKPCEHVGGLLSILLEQKTDLGLAEPPPDVTRATDEEDLVALALDERAQRAAAAYGSHLSARAKRSAASSASDFSVWREAIRLSSQVFGIVTMLSAFATQRFGNPSRLPSATSVGIPRVVVEISTTVMDARTA